MRVMFMKGFLKMKKINKCSAVIIGLFLAASNVLFSAATEVLPPPEETQAPIVQPEIPPAPPAVSVIEIIDMRGRTYSFDATKVFRFIDNPQGGEALLQMDEIQLNKEFGKISEIFDVQGSESSISINKKGELVKLTEDVQAILFDRAKTKNDLIAKVKNGDYTPYSLTFNFGPMPKKMGADLKKINALLGEYSTNFNAGEEQRTGNIALGASFINDRVLMPGEEFSFLKVAGPLSKSKGYKNAKIIQDGRFVDGVAGGACQVSTTLFNAVLQSGLKVTSRRNHSLPISYVPRGRDAAVASGLDFRFRNNLPNPIYLQAYVEKNRLTMKIYGNAQDYKEVKIHVKNTGERKYTLTRTINGVNDHFYSSYGVKKK